MKPLFIPLKGEYFDQFASGEKTVEYRPYGSRWNERTCQEGREVVLSRGYGRAHRLRGIVTLFDLSTRITLTPVWQSIYGNRHSTAACIHIALTSSAAPA